MKTNLEFAQSAKLKLITEIAKKAGIPNKYLSMYGRYKAKVDIKLLDKLKDKKDAKLILVTAITPTPAGEGKSTTTVGIGQAFARLGKKAMICLREPSLGPVFGIKGGATGGGCSQVLPMEDINLHFTGDMHAVTSANNLLAALVDNHIFQGNGLGIKEVIWRRCLDMNDRSLRRILLRRTKNEDDLSLTGFDITAASEVMAVLCLASDFEDLKQRLGRIIVGYDADDSPITASQIKAEGSMAVLLREAINPNLVQTYENTPAFVHGGPFANIAHGCNSLIATKLALKLADYVITEAGFGSDLGAEKFFDIKCRVGDLKPAAVVIVATVRALKMHGGLDINGLAKKDIKSLKHGLENLEKHLENIKGFQIPVIVAINKFYTDTKEEIEVVRKRCKELNVDLVLSEAWMKCGEGSIEIAEAILHTINTIRCKLRYSYNLEDGLKAKIEKIAKNIYGASGVLYEQEAETQIQKLTRLGYDKLPVCIAKTPASLSDDKSLAGRPRDFKITATNAKVSAGAGFVVIYCGKIMTMPGLGKKPAAESITIDKDGDIHGMF